jgi:hypothetical protein
MEPLRNNKECFPNHIPLYDTEFVCIFS